ncbi:zinc ribbon domain-containing protein [Xenophilus arseniciresistens]|uniref:Zinc ribbon domain-containing protein n=1 Tax=Xenophilus arseniciresistens TaxID=1283306 RepID=A0AAE3NC79_9BURK|nr:zinc ribbon domain-containing protein [Xenophilus arseniciresistens]MDA7418528.1 zinc ribbon domain-containing protein [Xenophilus arseniciresistens]
MAQVCSACGTDNRDAAKFCRGCGARLGEQVAAPGPAHWEHTQPADLLEQEQTVLIKPAAKRVAPAPPAAPQAQATPAPDAASAASAPRRWLLWVGLALGLLVVAAAFVLWLRGAGKAADPAPPQPAAAAPAPVAPAPAPTVLAPVEPVQTPSSAIPAVTPSLAPEPSAVQPAPAPAAAPAPAPSAPAAAPRPRPRRESAAAPVAPAPAELAPAAPVPAAPAPAPAPVPPEQTCGALGFFAKARCMAAECAKPALAKHPQCEAVREQQRREERIRNPEGG